MGFHGRGAAHKPKLTMRNTKRGREGGKARRHWSSGNAFSGVMNHASPSGSPMDKLGLADARRTLPVRMYIANCTVWWRRNNGLELLFMLRSRPLSSSEANGERYSVQ